jgi:glycosyltransferase involved in cell wall biosynthesis
VSAAVRIGMFTSSLPEPARKPGGVDVLVDRVSRQLAERGHEVRVYSYSPAAADAPYDHVGLRPRWLATSRPGRVAIAPLLLNALDTDGLDVLHLHGDDWLYVRRPLPTVRTFYGSALQEARTATRLRRQASQLGIFGLELLASRLATATYVLTPERDRTYRPRGTLGCGVDVHRRAGDERAATPTILFVGTWSGRKRGALLAQAFAEHVLPRHPSAELVMVADRIEPAPGIRWIDRPSDDELRTLYREAWVFCLPSAYEGLGIPYLEAMAEGTPVVATPNPGAEYLLCDGAGVLATPDRLGRVLAEVLGDAARRRELGRRGLERADEYDWATVCSQYEGAYRAAIELHRVPVPRRARLQPR